MPVEVYIYKGLPHCFSMVFTDLPQAKDFQARQNAYLDGVVKKANGQ